MAASTTPKPNLGRYGAWTALTGPPTQWITPQQATQIEQLGYRTLWVESPAGEAEEVLDCGRMQIPHRGAVGVSMPDAMTLRGSCVRVENRCARDSVGVRRSAWGG